MRQFWHKVRVWYIELLLSWLLKDPIHQKVMKPARDYVAFLWKIIMWHQLLGIHYSFVILTYSMFSFRCWIKTAHNYSLKVWGRFLCLGGFDSSLPNSSFLWDDSKKFYLVPNAILPLKKWSAANSFISEMLLILSIEQIEVTDKISQGVHSFLGSQTGKGSREGWGMSEMVSSSLIHYFYFLNSLKELIHNAGYEMIFMMV